MQFKNNILSSILLIPLRLFIFIDKEHGFD